MSLNGVWASLVPWSPLLIGGSDASPPGTLAWDLQLPNDNAASPAAAAAPPARNSRRRRYRPWLVISDDRMSGGRLINIGWPFYVRGARRLRPPAANREQRRRPGPV